MDAAVLKVMTERMNYLQKQINDLKRRNFEKDRGKDFEGSYTRVLFLMVITYWTLFGYMALVIKSKNPYLDAIVPTVGFNISTWSLPYVKEWWIQARHYYIHGESESASLRRLMVEEGRDEDGNAVITLSPNEAVEENPTTDMECGLPSQSDDATH